ncbi:MAG: hypothetical protein HYR85_11850 [Planctomycetes bacterium]|nr:hypothetical protein [Planctomycetota bacterium]MBI3843976.1 hypothetical protein [Planctomycetota bacterium]
MVELAFSLTGAFATLLGLLHFTFPRRFGFVELLNGSEPAPPDFRLGPYRKELRRSDVLGIVYVMNHGVSFVILSIGVFDLFATRWLGTSAGMLVSVWAAAFWWLRSATQLYLGRRRGDFFVLFVFAVLGLVQVLPALVE